MDQISIKVRLILIVTCLSIFLSMPAYAQMGRFVVEIAVIEANFVKDENLFDKIMTLSTEEGLPESLPPKVGDNIQILWHQAAVKACNPYIKTTINDKFEHLPLKKMEESVEQIKEEIDDVNSNCRYKFFLDNWKNISEMINEKYTILRCSKASTLSLRGLSCRFKGYKTKVDYKNSVVTK